MVDSSRQRGQVVRSVARSPSVKSIWIRPERRPFALRAGQWVNLHVTTAGGEQRRSYSVASAPSESTDALELAVTRVPDGEVSPVLHELQDGDCVELDGPHGFFVREPVHIGRPALFVGTGTGLAPLRAMLHEALEGEACGSAAVGVGGVGAPAPPSLTLLFGCRSRADVLWSEDLKRWEAAHPHFRCHRTLSRADRDWRGSTGHVQEHVVALANALDAPHVYICGLSAMVREVRGLLKRDAGLDRRSIHSERFD